MGGFNSKKNKEPEVNFFKCDLTLNVHICFYVLHVVYYAMYNSKIY